MRRMAFGKTGITARGVLCLGLLLCSGGFPIHLVGGEIVFNRDIRAILSNQCLTCHGPDESERKAGLRLDTEAGSRADLGGYFAIKPGDPDASELMRRIATTDPDDRMPPPELGPGLTASEQALVKQWILEGATYQEHWAYVPPVKPELPPVKDLSWVQNPVDHFVLAKLEEQGWHPSEPADRWSIARRVALDLTGLPPSLEEVEAFVADSSPFAYERFVDRQLHKDAFGERWARVWLDLARYADSAGYADDPPRTIWAYRDYVIRALNDNLPFDQFTIEQLAGDLLPNPTEQQLVATAFHRNTMTNNEGGTSDEQFRNEAIVDRVNTTMAVWMGTTMACAQCHTHKYDPITQEEYFQFFAFFNNTADSDRRDEAPTIELFTEMQKRQLSDWKEKAAELRWLYERPNDKVRAEQRGWEQRLTEPVVWQPVTPDSVTADSRKIEVGEDGAVVAQGSHTGAERYEWKADTGGLAATGLRLEVAAQAVDYNVSKVDVRFMPANPQQFEGRFVRIEIPGNRKILSLAEVEVFLGDRNLARSGTASQSSIGSGGVAARAIDGSTDGNYEANSTTHTATSRDPWWEVDLGQTMAVDAIAVWNRTDGGKGISQRLGGFRIKLLDEQREVVWEQAENAAPEPSVHFGLDGSRVVPLLAAEVDYSAKGFDPNTLAGRGKAKRSGWSVAGQSNEAHQLTLVFAEALPAAEGTLTVLIEQASGEAEEPIDRFRLSWSESSQLAELAQLPTDVRSHLTVATGKRNPKQSQRLQTYYRTLSPSLEPVRTRLNAVEKQIKDQRPFTTVPVLRELAMDKRRETLVQVRGNYQNTEGRVTEGTPAVFHPLPAEAPRDRLLLAQWLVSDDNPLTARVIANRHWEQLFGTGLVSTSEEFGSQGELPSHPDLLDWLAVELRESGWDLKHLIRLMATSATYRQSVRLTPELLEQDPANRYFTRGPRIRLSAEMIRDQALAIGGLLSEKKFGPPSRPPQPKLGISAAFGSGIDWETSPGADKYRRGIYTQWRRSNPYPSMTTFDAPNREVCTVRRPRSNTPLQALVTLNDPVFVEAAQALARRTIRQSGSLAEQAAWLIRAALIRPARPAETERLVALFEQAKEAFDGNPKEAESMATIPLGKPEFEADLSDLAAWTVVGNAVLNLDEIFLKR